MTRVRADIIELYVIRGSTEVLQLRRVQQPLAGTWQPMMGHAEAGESAVDGARREAREELGLELGPDLRESACSGWWQLETVQPYYIARVDTVVLSPRFVARVGDDWRPVLNDEHDAWRWSPLHAAEWMWPGQRQACAEIARLILGGTPAQLAVLRLG